MKNRYVSSWPIPDDLAARGDLTMLEKFILAVMIRIGGFEKPIHPSHKWIAKISGTSADVIRKTLKKLDQKGEVRSLGKRWKINEYIVTGIKVRSSPEELSGDSPEQKSGDNRPIQSRPKQTDIVADGTAAPEGKEINELIDLFKKTNPSWEQLFGNKTERAAIKRLLKNHGREKLEKMICYLPTLNAMPYAPVTTTPYELEKKLGKIIAFMAQKKNANKFVITKV